MCMCVCVFVCVFIIQLEDERWPWESVPLYNCVAVVVWLVDECTHTRVHARTQAKTHGWGAYLFNFRGTRLSIKSRNKSIIDSLWSLINLHLCSQTYTHAQSHTDTHTQLYLPSFILITSNLSQICLSPFFPHALILHSLQELTILSLFCFSWYHLRLPVCSPLVPFHSKDHVLIIKS